MWVSIETLCLLADFGDQDAITALEMLWDSPVQLNAIFYVNTKHINVAKNTSFHGPSAPIIFYESR